MAQPVTNVLVTAEEFAIAPERCPVCAVFIARVMWGVVEDPEDEPETSIRYWADPCGHTLDKMVLTLRPVRAGNEIERWLKDRRNGHVKNSPEWKALNDAVKDYRARTAAGRSLRGNGRPV